jgi:hypothetical protein
MFFRHALAGSILIIGAVTGADAAQTPDACTLLSLAEVSQAGGLVVTDSDRVSTTEGTTCQFRARSGRSVTISLWPATPERFPELRETLELGGETETVSGVGDAAFYWADRIYAHKGRQGITVYFTGDNAREPDRKTLEAVKAIAAAGLAKL